MSVSAILLLLPRIMSVLLPVIHFAPFQTIPPRSCLITQLLRRVRSGSLIRRTILCASVAYSQPRRPRTGENQPPLTHRSPTSPSAQVALLAYFDAPIILIAGR